MSDVKKPFRCRLIDKDRVVNEQVIEAKDHPEAYSVGNDGMGPFECIARGEPVRWVEVMPIRGKRHA